MLASAWLSVLSLEAFLMTIATAFILLAMSKERTELRHKTAAMTDPLTGLLNRRAFLQDAEALLQQQIARDRPIGVLLIDLDHFKSINDRFGHAVGDKVLQIFAKTAQANLRQTDLVGRLGGEEFTVVLADASIDNAYLVADRLRNAFAVGAAVIDGPGAARDREHRRVGDRRSAPGSRQAHHARRSGALSRQGARAQSRRGRAVRDRSRRRARMARPCRSRAPPDLHSTPRHAAQTFAGVAGMSMIDAAALRNRIRDRVHDRRDRAGGAGLARRPSRRADWWSRARCGSPRRSAACPPRAAWRSP